MNACITSEIHKIIGMFRMIVGLHPNDFMYVIVLF